MPQLTISQTLYAAAELIETKGWSHPLKGGDRNCYCASTAISTVFNGDFYGREPAQDFFANFISDEQPSSLPFMTIWRWNDEPHRTQPEVIYRLREAAEVAREKGL